MAEIIKLKDWGFGEMMDTEEIEEEAKGYQSILDETTRKLLADAIKRAREKDNTEF